MKQCKNGHVYDEKKNRECPYCSGAGGVFQPLGDSAGAQPNFPGTVSITSEPQPGFPKTMPLTGGDSNSFPPTVPVDNGFSTTSDKMGVTIAISETSAGINPVKGWLVTVDGEQKGISYVIHGEQNLIGRGRKFDVNLSADLSVSSSGSAVIAFDSVNNTFFFSPIFGSGKNNVYLNNSILLMPAELKDYDRIRFGQDTYVFRSFCNKDFTY